jgi:hypothetical protein
MVTEMRRNVVWRLTVATWLAAIALGGLAATLSATARATAGGVAAGLAIAGTATGGLALCLAAPESEATAVGGRCDGQSFTVPARHPPRTIRLVSPDGRTWRYKRRGPPGTGRVVYHAD